MAKETLIYQGDSKWSRNAYIKFVGDKIVFDCSDGEYGPIEFDIQAFYEAELKHAEDISDELENQNKSRILTYNKKTMTKEEAKNQLIEVLTNQVVDLTMMSKIELGDDVIAEIKRLKDIINE
jgi:hypothetical protein